MLQGVAPLRAAPRATPAAAGRRCAVACASKPGSRRELLAAGGALLAGA